MSEKSRKYTRKLELHIQRKVAKLRKKIGPFTQRLIARHHTGIALLRSAFSRSLLSGFLSKYASPIQALLSVLDLLQFSNTRDARNDVQPRKSHRLKSRKVKRRTEQYRRLLIGESLEPRIVLDAYMVRDINNVEVEAHDLFHREVAHFAL